MLVSKQDRLSHYLDDASDDLRVPTLALHLTRLAHSNASLPTHTSASRTGTTAPHRADRRQHDKQAWRFAHALYLSRFLNDSSGLRITSSKASCWEEIEFIGHRICVTWKKYRASSLVHLIANIKDRLTLDFATNNLTRGHPRHNYLRAFINSQYFTSYLFVPLF